MSMLICNEGKEDKKYHIAYQLNQKSPVIPYCRMPGFMEEAVQVMSDNPKICERCRKAAGIGALTSIPGAVLELQPPPKEEHPAVAALIALRKVADDATSDEAFWWQQKIDEACVAAGIADESAA